MLNPGFLFVNAIHIFIRNFIYILDFDRLTLFFFTSYNISIEKDFNRRFGMKNIILLFL